MMRQFKISLFITLITIFTFLSAQPIQLDEGDGLAHIRITSIQKGNGKIGYKTKTNVHAKRGEFIAVNKDVSMMAGGGQLIKWGDKGVKAIEIPRNGTAIYDLQFLPNNNLLYFAFPHYDPFKQSERKVLITFYDTTREKVSSSHQIIIKRIINEKAISKDGTTIAAIISPQLHLFTKQEDRYNEVVKKISGFYLMLSKFGNRLFYNTNYAEKYIVKYIDKQDEGWSEPIILPHSIFPQLDTDEYWVEPTALTNNGKTIVVQTNNDRLALIHEKKGIWSEPEYVGKSKRINIHMNPRIVCSDDASVIAVQQPKKMNWENFPITFDVYVFIKDRYGRWSKFQVNHPDVHVGPGLTLTRDGKKLLWVPDRRYSSAKALKMK